MRSVTLGLFLTFSCFGITSAADFVLLTQPPQSVPNAFGEPVSPTSSTNTLTAKFYSSPGARTLDPSFYKPTIVASGPMIQTKGIYPGREFFYITDTGKDARHDENGRIWRFNPATGDLELFYTSKDLINPKWIFYHESDSGKDDILLISDYGREPVRRSPGTGEGAKVVVVEISNSGEIGKVRTLHEGAPFRSPEGVTLIGDTVIVSDWAAGPETTRYEAPNDIYLSGRVFALPLDGSQPPVELFPSKKWVTLIGACQFNLENGDTYLRLIDIDGGRIDDEYPTFERSGLAKYWTSRVISKKPLVLSELSPTPLFENTIINFKVDNASKYYSKIIISNEWNNFTFYRGDLSKNYNTITVQSPISESFIDLIIQETDEENNTISISTKSIEKSLSGAILPFDNKHAGAITKPTRRASGNTEQHLTLSGSADGSSQTLFLFKPLGGPLASLWHGAPFSQPMGVQFARDGKSVYVTDQDAGEDGKSVLFEIPMPSDSALAQTFIGN